MLRKCCIISGMDTNEISDHMEVNNSNQLYSLLPEKRSPLSICRLKYKLLDEGSYAPKKTTANVGDKLVQGRSYYSPTANGGNVLYGSPIHKPSFFRPLFSSSPGNKYVNIS